VGVAAWATLVEPRLFTVRRYTLPVLPEGAAPLRVLQLSDLHLTPWQHSKIDWVRRLAELRPDLVVLTGDQMGHRLARGPLLHALAPFAQAGVPGVFVHGSNDYFGPVVKNPFGYLTAPSSGHTRSRTPDIDTAALSRGFEKLGFTDLNNAATRMQLRGVDLELHGLGDPHIDLDDAATLDASIAALPKWRKKQQPVQLGVIHAPYQHALNDLLDRGAEAIFAGHTHGGQVRVPGIGALTANCDLPVSQARGLSVWYDAERAAFLHVSAGLGASMYAPVRFACRPEASLITLEAAR
jgi:predicted MPP superfamily phosphohydrolase